MPKKRKTNYNIVKKKLVALLESREIFSEGDLVLIDNLIMMIELRDMAWNDIKENGISKKVVSNNKSVSTQKSTSVTSLMEVNKAIVDITKKLALSPRDRFDLGLSADKNPKDGF